MKKAGLLILFTLIALNIETQNIKFYVESGKLDYLDCPVSFRLDPDIYSGKENLLLHDVSDINREKVKDKGKQLKKLKGTSLTPERLNL